MTVVILGSRTKLDLGTSAGKTRISFCERFSLLRLGIVVSMSNEVKLLLASIISSREVSADSSCGSPSSNMPQFDK